MRLGNSVGGIKRVVEATPARIGGIENIARIVQWHDQLGTRHGSDLCVDRLANHLEVIHFGRQVTDIAQHGPISCRIQGLIAMLFVPGVYLTLQPGALCQEFSIAWSEIAHHLGESVPKNIRWNFDSRQQLIDHKIMQLSGDG